MCESTVLSGESAWCAEASFHYMSGAPKREESGTFHMSEGAMFFLFECI